MKVVVFAAAGKVGQEVVHACLAKGYEVVAVVREGQVLPFSDANVKTVNAELTDTTRLREALADTQAVVTAFGPGPMTRDTALSDGIKNVLDAMREEQVDRIVLLSTNSVPAPEDRFDLSWALIKFIIRFGAPGAVAEVARMANIVRDSDRRYTLVRVPFLTEEEKKGRVRFGNLGRGQIGYCITRADLAAFMVDQIELDAYTKKAVSVSN